MSLRTPRPRNITFFRVVRVFRGLFSKEVFMAPGGAGKP